MKKLLTIGEKEVAIAIDRDITCQIMNRFNGFFADFFELAADANAKNTAENESTDSNSTSDTIRMVADKIRENKISTILMLSDNKLKVMKYALPKLIKKANSELDDIMSAKLANDLIEYCAENDAEDVLADVVFDFVNEGFIQAETEKKPKISITVQ